MTPGSSGETAWLRVAWYASADGSGSQLSTADSATITYTAGELITVGTGAVLPPPNARSAKIRVMLRPSSAAPALLIVDDVTFAPVDAPTAVAAPASTSTPTPTATPAPTAVATPASMTTPLPTAPPTATASVSAPVTEFPTATAVASVADQRPITATDAAAITSGAAASLLRITELMPDPPQSGRDADFEWVEMTNVGNDSLSLAGLVLRDNAGESALPNLALPAGGVIVIAAQFAEIEGAVAYRLTGAILNGLANGGDRLALLDAEGRQLDAICYGSDTTYLRAERVPIPAPGAGHSITRDFADDGSLLGVEISDEPTPGLYLTSATALAPTGTTPEPAAADERSSSDGGADVAAWVVLTTLAVGALAAAAGLRLREILRGED